MNTETTIRAVCIRQPWASMIARGEKTIELRTWPTKHRGPLLIVASKSPKLYKPNGDALPTGCAVCIVDVVDCRPAVATDAPAACCAIEPGEFAWVLRNVREVAHTPIRGQLKPWPVTLPAL